jgi:hypothetical protein
MKKIASLILGVGLCFAAMGEDVAVFPVQGVNTAKSFSDAFGVLLANKYEKVSSLSVINSLKSGRAIGPDSNLNEAAKNLGVSEYLEITAVGLYVSLKEQKEMTHENGVIVNINEESDDDDDDDDDDDISSADQRLLDNSKTVVTVCRRTQAGNLIHKVEMTLLTYGDIEESTERIALALFKKISVEEALTPTTITRREGMGYNKAATVGRVKGIRLGMSYPLSATTSTKFSPFMTIMFDYRFDFQKFFLEWAVGGRLPAQLFDESVRSYGGVNLEIGSCYYFVNDYLGSYIGGGINPYFDFIGNIDSGIQLGVAPFLKIGMMFPQTSKVRVYFDFKVAQNVIPIITGRDYDYSYSYTYESSPTLPKKKNYPTEIGMEIGIAW